MTDERLRLGEFGIQARLVKPPVHEGEQPKQGEGGHTMVYSAVRERDRSRPKRPEEAVGALVSTRAVVSIAACGQAGPSLSTDTRYASPARVWKKYGAPESYRQALVVEPGA